MVVVENIIEENGIEEYLVKRNLIDQYKKVKKYIIEGLSQQTNFGERKPKGSNIRYFRINKQYRAGGSFDIDGDLIIFKIDNHSK